MRLIGQLTGEPNARVFSDFLIVQKIENNLERSQGDEWDVWIRDEEELARAAEWLAEFKADPKNKKFQGLAGAAQTVKAAQAEEQKRYEKRVKQRQDLFRSVKGYGIGPLTFALIFLSIVVGLNTKLGAGGSLFQQLSMSGIAQNYGAIPAGLEGLPERVTSIKTVLPEISSGEVWRLVTPIFLHFGLMHILFNMLWMRDLGSMIEGRQGTFTLFILVICLAIFSNLVQCLVNGPRFGGMSGVVYGLEGYIWIRGHRDPASGLFLHRYTIISSMVWFVLCFTGVFGNIANGAHAGGLALGMAWGYFSSLRRS